jgi:rhodanese-related sulfurtransferase
MQLNPDFVDVVEKVIPKDRKLVVGCLSGGRSQRACEMLEEVGFRDLTNVVGGYGGQRDSAGALIVAGWKEEGLPCDSTLGEAAYEAQRKKAGI